MKEVGGVTQGEMDEIEQRRGEKTERWMKESALGKVGGCQKEQEVEVDVDT